MYIEDYEEMEKRKEEEEERARKEEEKTILESVEND